MNCKNCGHEIFKKGNRFRHEVSLRGLDGCLVVVSIEDNRQILCHCKNPEPERGGGK